MRQIAATSRATRRNRGRNLSAPRPSRHTGRTTRDVFCGRGRGRRNTDGFVGRVFGLERRTRDQKTRSTRNNYYGSRSNANNNFARARMSGGVLRGTWGTWVRGGKISR